MNTTRRRTARVVFATCVWLLAGPVSWASAQAQATSQPTLEIYGFGQADAIVDFKVNDPKIDDLAVRQRQTMDAEERATILTELMDYDLDQVTRLWTVAPYKINLRKPNFYNLIDTEAAWNPVGWGSCGLDTAWKA